MGEAARGPFPTLNLRRVAGSRFGREVGRLVGPQVPGQSRTADWVLVLAFRGWRTEGAWDPGCWGGREGGPGWASAHWSGQLRGGGSRKQLTSQGVTWAPVHRLCRCRGVAGRALPPDQVSRGLGLSGLWAALPVALHFLWAGRGRADRQGRGRRWGRCSPDRVEVKAAWSCSCTAERLVCGPTRRRAVCHAARQHGLPPCTRQLLWVAVICALQGGTPACQPPLKAHGSTGCHSTKHKAGRCPDQSAAETQGAWCHPLRPP